MKLLIISDSHGLTDEIVKIKNRHQIDYYIHCGDSELSFHSLVMKEFMKVAGNCDLDTYYPQDLIMDKQGIKIFITHGHHYHVKRNLHTLSYRAEEERAAIICFGHTHIAGTGKMNGQLFINPGSIQLPRGRKEKTYAILDVNSGNQVAQISFYTIEGEEVQELYRQYTLEK